MDLKKYIRSIPDYPKKGILFRDITTLIKDNQAFRHTIDKIVEVVSKQAQPQDYIVIMSNGAFGGIYQKLIERLNEL